MSGTEGGLFGMGLGAWFWWITLIIIIVVMIKVLIGGSSGSEPEHDDSPPEGLKGRHVRGETDEEEFRRQK